MKNILLLLTLLVINPCLAQISEHERCLLDKINTMPAVSSLADLKNQCPVDKVNVEIILANEAVKSDFAQRIAQEREGVFNPFALMPHKANFIMASTVSKANQQPYNTFFNPAPLDSEELIFQVSLKSPLKRNLAGGDVFVAYTTKSWWQLFNKDLSSPFRETNYEPEIFWRKPTNKPIAGWNISAVRLGFVHQSNGRTIPLSRSWNRIYSEITLEKDRWSLIFKPWYRIPEEEKDNVNETEGDDNPDISKFMGFGEYTVGYRTESRHKFSLLTRYNFRDDAKGAAQLTWSFPFSKRYRGYAQLFTGYGDSLIDYDRSITRLSIGVALTDVIH